MSEVIKDCAFKLFGKTITFPPEEVFSDIALSKQRLCSSATSISLQDTKDVCARESSIYPTDETLTDSSNSNTPEEKRDLSHPNSPDEEPSESSISHEKELKKPEKLLPCPRCNSLDTKFCYFNNYNANQPRHFCKNCQRYWTAGGTMRNVPVGSGRRKNKNASVRNYAHYMVLDELKAKCGDSVNGIQFSQLKPTSFLVFGSESMNNDSWSCSTGKEQLNSDCVRGTGSGISPDMAPRPGSNPNWPYQNNTTTPGFGGVPVAFYPCTTYWGCAVPNLPLNRTCSSGPSDMCISPASSNLGKHFRDGVPHGLSNLGKENSSCMLIPKTLKIDDPNEAAKSSIWSTLGNKNKKIGSINGTSLFKAFESKGNQNSNPTSSMMVMRANPAALSRSLEFHESA